MMYVLNTPVLFTALLTLFFSSKSPPASPWLGCNKTSVGQVHHSTAGGLTNYSGTELFMIWGVISKGLIYRYMNKIVMMYG